MDDESREMVAAGTATVVRGSEEERQQVKHLEALDSLSSEDAIQTVLASQLEIHFSKYYFVGLIVDISNVLGLLG